MSRRNDDGAALILAICLTLVASVIGASLVMLAQTETYASLNYRLMSQARYAAESGVQKRLTTSCIPTCRRQRRKWRAM